MRLLTHILAILSLALAVHAQDRNVNFSHEKEAALGAQLADQIRRKSTPLGLPKVENYVTNVGLRLAAQMPDASENWKFAVIRDRQMGPTHEPMSLPGGWIFIPAQLILAAHGEAEFAGMLAHAMAHVSKRQMIRQARGVSSLAAIPLVFFGAPVALGGDDENQWVPAGYVQIQRRFELEADQVAVKAMGAAGFDPDSLLNYVERTQPRFAESDFSQLPPLAIRVSNLRRSIQDSSAAQPAIVSTDLFQSIQDAVRHDLLEITTPKTAHKVPSLLHPDN